MVRKPYAPGQKGKRRPPSPSEYGKELREKQKLRNWYNLKEKQFGNYVREALKKSGRADTADLLARLLESRLDNVVFRLGFASSRSQARQLVTHGNFLVNGKRVDIPSYRVKKGDEISPRPAFAKKPLFQELKKKLKDSRPPAWLSLETAKLKGKVVSSPSLEEAAPPAEISAIFEYYSR